MSTYMQKQKALLDKLEATGYAVYEGDKDEALDHVGSMLTGFADYANIIIRENVMMPIWRQRCEPEEFRDRVTDIDRQRRIQHEACIANVNVLNRISGKLDLEPFMDIDTDDRNAVADAIGAYVNEVYNDGVHGGIDAATMERREQYDRKQVGERLRSLESDMAARGLSAHDTQEAAHAQGLSL